MSFTWPNYDHEALGDGRTWSGKFDSYNQRTDEAFYYITIHDAGGDQPPVMVDVATGMIPDSEFGTPDFPNKLRYYILLELKAGRTSS